MQPGLGLPPASCPSAVPLPWTRGLKAPGLLKPLAPSSWLSSTCSEGQGSGPNNIRSNIPISCPLDTREGGRGGAQTVARALWRVHRQHYLGSEASEKADVDAVDEQDVTRGGAPPTPPRGKTSFRRQGRGGGRARAISPPPTVCRRGRGRLGWGSTGGQLQVSRPGGPRSGQEWLRPREGLGRGAGGFWSWARHWWIGGRGLTAAVPSATLDCSASEMAIFNSSFMGGEGGGGRGALLGVRKMSAKLSSLERTEWKRGAKPQGLRRGRKRLDGGGVDGRSRTGSGAEERRESGGCSSAAGVKAPGQ